MCVGWIKITYFCIYLFVISKNSLFLLLFCFNNFCLFVFVCLHHQQHPSNQPSCHSSTNLFIHSVVHSFIQTTKQTTIHSTKQLTKTTVSETNRPSNNFQANLIIIPEISSTPSQQPTPAIPGLPNNRKPHYPLERESSWSSSIIIICKNCIVLYDV